MHRLLKKLIPLVVLLPLVLAACTSGSGNNNNGNGGGNFGNQVTHPVAGRRFLAIEYGQGM